MTKIRYARFSGGQATSEVRGDDVGRRIGGAGGGSDPGKKSGGGLVVAGALVVVLGAGGATTAGLAGGGAASGSSSGASSSGGKSGKTRNGDTVTARLTARGIRARAELTDDSSDCVANAYGQVQTYLREHPCRALARSLIEVRDQKGDVALVAVASVEMPDAEQATELRRLMDSPGTGNVTELSRERGRYRSVRFTGDIYESRQDDAVVSNAQVQAVARGWTGLSLTSIATNAVD